MEGNTNTIALVDDPPHAFMAFHYYIYHKDVIFQIIPEQSDLVAERGEQYI